MGHCQSFAAENWRGTGAYLRPERQYSDLLRERHCQRNPAGYCRKASSGDIPKVEPTGEEDVQAIDLRFQEKICSMVLRRAGGKTAAASAFADL